MNYEVITLEKQLVVGNSVITTNENGQSMKDIGAMWQTFLGNGVFESINNKISPKGIGLYTDYEGDATKPYRFMCCTQVSENDNPELESRVIEGGKYAKFTVKGDIVQAVAKAWQQIWTMDLDRKFSFDFELYHNDSEDMTNQTIDIFISLN